MTYSAWSVVFGEQPSTAKWNLLGSNDAHFYSFLGDNEAWQTWSPSYTNITVDNGTVVSKYTQIGKTIHVIFRLVFGSGTSIDGSNPEISAPVTAHADMVGGSSNALNLCRLWESGVGTFIGQVGLTDVDNFLIREFNTVDGNANSLIDNTAINATSPHTWGTADELEFSVTYEAS